MDPGVAVDGEFHAATRGADTAEKGSVKIFRLSLRQDNLLETLLIFGVCSARRQSIG